MKNLILLIFTTEDLAAVPQAVQRLKSMAIDRLWIMHNPHLGLPYPATATALDEEIALCEHAKASAIARENFTDATNYRDQGNALRVKRDLEIKNAYKGLPKSQLDRVYAGAFGSITAKSTGIPNILIEAIGDPLSPDQAFQYLHQQTGQWVDQFPHGEYGIAWIRALPEPANSPTRSQLAPRVSVKPLVDPNGEAPIIATKDSPREVLESIPFFKLRQVAVAAAIDFDGKTKKHELIDGILSKQHALVPA